MNARIGLTSRTAFFFFGWETPNSHVNPTKPTNACLILTKQPKCVVWWSTRAVDQNKRSGKHAPSLLFFQPSSTGPCDTYLQPSADGKMPSKKILNVIAAFNGLDNVFTWFCMRNEDFKISAMWDLLKYLIIATYSDLQIFLQSNDYLTT